MRPVRIAAHNGARIYGGGEKWALLLLAGLQDRGHDVRFFCRDRAMVERAEALGVPAAIGRLGGEVALHHAVRFAGTLRRFRPDTLLVTTFKKIWLAGLSASLARVPLVVSRVGLSTDRPGRNRLYQVAYRRWVDAVLLNSDDMRMPFLEDLPGYDPRRVATVMDGIDVDARPTRPGQIRLDLGVPEGAPVIGTVARLSTQKRLDRLLETVTRLATVHCVIAGEGELEAELKSLAHSLGIADRVHFLGFRSDVPNVLDALDVFVLTSDREGMANSMLEALAAGVPVVSSPVSGAREALAPDERGTAPGMIVEPDPARLAGQIEALLGDERRLEDMGREASHRARERFSIDRSLDAWEQVLSGAPPEIFHQGASPQC